MPNTSRRLLVGLALFLAAGTLVGWLYDEPVIGALVACFLALVWQVRQLVAFDEALRAGDFERFRFGEGVWQQMFARFRYLRDRGDRYKRDYRRFLKDVRQSTDAMPDGAVILDETNEIVICNRAAKRLAGLKRKKDRGQRIDNILRDPKLTGLLRDNDATSTVDIASPVIEGAWLNCRVVPYGGNQKLLLLRDVTERINLNKMRRDFVANASHELRSPLTVISGYLDSLDDTPGLPEFWVQPIAQMRTQAARMAKIVSELLELARLESGGRASTRDVIDVGGLIAAGKKTFQAQDGAPQIVIEVESAAQLLGDRGEIESVITNLLSNAVRHTPVSGTVTLIWRSDVGGGDLIVRDTGEGVPEDDIPRLTERFFRVDRGRARKDGGVGLGLAIVKHVLVRHEAELRIESSSGQGSEFRVHFPAFRVVVDPPVPLAGNSWQS